VIFWLIQVMAIRALEKAWTQEIRRRVEEIKSGKAKAIPADEAMAKARRALHKIRRSSLAR
jgi:putative addiction module component (TIGR02574 family)